ncbi:hypothetical protein [Spongiibacter tropicus]|uniref:hypothetical protein n=1 Tax=Spongiibacter tropicus TaxID=454602 RepID=UPI0012F9FA2F|nr:hypothetical protein [Spongiibacter tropicus]
MKSLRLAVWLLITSSLLAACGGGGDARSPDRPGLSIDPSTMQLEFVDGITTLPGTGNNRISVRMMALQSDGINKNVGPAQNITSRVNWTLTNTPLAALSSDEDGDLSFRTVTRNGIGTVIDIESTQQMEIDAAVVSASITGTFQGTSRVGDFTIVPPTPSGAEQLVGKDLILLDPTIPGDSETNGYRLLQYFTNTSVPENRTHTVVICSSSEFATVEAGQPVSPGDGVVDVTYTNPFTPDGNNEAKEVILFAVDGDSNDACVGAEPNGERQLKVTLRPATFSSVDICAVINPAGDACSAGGAFNEDYIADCRGLDTDSIFVPAAQNLQFVARKTFNSTTDTTQTLTEYLCSEERENATAPTWSVDEPDIFSSDPAVDPDQGTAATIDRLAYAQLVEVVANPNAVVTGNFGEGVPELQDSLTLNLVDARVDAIKIERTDGLNADDPQQSPDTIYVNSFLDGIEYRALCQFSDLSGTEQEFETCPNGLIRWTSSAPDVAEPSAEATPVITLEPKTGVQLAQEPFPFTLTVTYIGSDEDISGSRNIEARDPGELQALRLFMVPNKSNPDEVEIDQFACVGRSDLVSSVSNDENFVENGQQFEIYAVFSNIPGSADPNLDDPNGPDSGLVYVTPETEIQFSAESGYWSGSWADPAMCQSISNLGEIPDLGEETGGVIVNSPAASFDPNKKGRLKSDGLLRLNTVCVTGFALKDESKQIPEDIRTVDGTTVLVLPAADDTLLASSNELCETLEPVLTLGGSLSFVDGDGPGILLPVIYGVSLVADPLLASLVANDDGGALPVEEILDGLLYGDFTGLSADAPDLGFGLATITDGLINGIEQVPGLGLLVDFLDSCVLSQTLDFLGNLLTGILTFDAGAFEDIADINFDNCAAIFEGGL